jgi:hypothetical protein
MEHIGIDVHKNQSQICVLTKDGELIEKRIVTELGREARGAARRARARTSPLPQAVRASADDGVSAFPKGLLVAGPARPSMS